MSYGNEAEGTTADVTRDFLIEDGTRLYISGVIERAGVGNSNFGGD